VRWEDPTRSAGVAPSLSGIDFLTGIVRGEIPPPPALLLLGMTISAIEPGRVTFAVTPAEFHYNPLGVVHGGVISTLADSAMACAIQSTLPAGVGLTTIELKVNFLRALTAADGEVSCAGSVIHAGGRIATAECRVTDARGRIFAHATTTCMLLR
jgi:uncharacterized protein (TIGR00369 family)